jgi:alkanesulfonate monooxygenase SsuD/methylene tetrahydromethanopterin reductase-like flavin-dependent oxidoreductase (luciferase family)
VADGVVLAEGAGPTYVRESIERAGSPDPFRVSVFTALAVGDDAQEMRRTMAPFVAGLIDGSNPAPNAHPHIEEIRERHEARGVDGIADMPADWWIELGAIGTFDDAVRHAEALAEAGADDVAFFPGPTVERAREDLDHVARLAAALR